MGSILSSIIGIYDFQCVVSDVIAEPVDVDVCILLRSMASEATEMVVSGSKLNEDFRLASCDPKLPVFV